MSDDIEQATTTPDAAGDEDLVSALRLALVSGIGPRMTLALLGHFGSAAAVLAAAPSDLRAVEGIGAKLSQAIARAPSREDAEREIERVPAIRCRRADAAFGRIPAPAARNS